MESEAQRGDQGKQINKEHFLTACVCVFLSVYEHLLWFSSVLCTAKYWFRLNSLSPAPSTGKRHGLRFTWHSSINVGVHLSYSHGVRVFVRCLYSIMMNSLMFSPSFLSCFLCSHRIENVTMWGFFSLSSGQRIKIFTSHALQNVLGFFTAMKHIYNCN